MAKKTAVILFNLGGPTDPKAVKPFLFNLFNDKHIIGAPAVIRYCLAKFLSWRRTPEATEIYAHLGGASPLNEQTEEQRQVLEGILGENFKVFTAMRYWRPRARETLRAVMAYQPQQVVLLSLYPQYSYSTTLSSFEEWSMLQGWEKASWSTAIVKAYPSLTELVDFYVTKIKALLEAHPEQSFRILFSAHGLPEKFIEAGDPYQQHIHQTAAAVMASLPNQEFHVTYQSRVGPLKWVDPYTDKEIERAGVEKKPLIVVPVAFVSEHSETLVELDIEYQELAQKAGVPLYLRVPTPQSDITFLKGLANLVRKAAADASADSFPCLMTRCPKNLIKPKVCCLKRGRD